MRAFALITTAAWVGLVACRASQAPMLAPSEQKDSPAMTGEAAPVEAPGAGRAPDGTWELVRDGAPPIVLHIVAGAVVVARGDATERAVWSDVDADRQAITANEREATVEAGTTCMEVVAVEDEALVVKMGTITDGHCVLGDETLRFTRQVQR